MLRKLKMESVTSIYAEIESLYPERIITKILKRGEALIHKGETEKYGYIVLSGALRVVHFNGEREQNIRFGYKGSFITSLPSFFDGSPSKFSVEAIRKTEIRCFPKELFFKVLDRKENGTQILLELISSLTHHFVDREIDLLITSPKDLYHRVLERSPELFQEIPALHIANYLGMSPEHLSRLRKS